MLIRVPVAQGFFDPVRCAVKGGSRWNRSKILHIEFLKNEDSLRPYMPEQFLNGSHEIRVVHQDKSTYDSIERLLELQERRIANPKLTVVSFRA
jgi:hypothetical protein